MSRMRPDYWQSLGFASEPSHDDLASRGIRSLFRVWGGSSLRYGAPDSEFCWFGLRAPRSRSEAERLCNVMIYGNACRTLTEFRPPLGLQAWIGPVDFGVTPAAEWSSSNAIQVVMPTSDVRLMTIVGEWPLQNDLRGVYVHPYRATPPSDRREFWS